MSSVQDEYPPLTSVDEYPLHPDVYPGHYWACTQPERPRDDTTAYDWRCASCVLAAAVDITYFGDGTMWWMPTGGSEPIEKKLSWMVARSIHWGVR